MIFSTHKLLKDQVSISIRVFQQKIRCQITKFYRTTLLNTSSLLASLTERLKHLHHLCCNTDGLRAIQIPTPKQSQRSNLAMQGGADRLLDRIFVVLDVGQVDRELIQGHRRGILRFRTGESYHFIKSKTADKGRENQDKLKKDEKYILHRGKWDSSIIDRRMIRVTEFERVDE